MYAWVCSEVQDVAETQKPRCYGWHTHTESKVSLCFFLHTFKPNHLSPIHNTQGLPILSKFEDMTPEKWGKEVDVIFCCLPHATTQLVIASLPPAVKVVDLSADFRLADVKVYEKWYGGEHKAPELQKEAVYAIPEFSRDQIKKARLIANPGCYPTAAQLPLVPLLKAGLILKDDIIIDAKSGTTGAGRSPKQV